MSIHKSKIMSSTSFAPVLYIPNHCKDVSFYTKAFGATELRRFMNDDDSYHVAEFDINGAMFHLHEITASPVFFTPGKYNGTTVNIGLFVEDVDKMMASAVAAGAVVINPAKDFEYGYRQGDIRDPFGHLWTMQMKI